MDGSHVGILVSNGDACRGSEYCEGINEGARLGIFVGGWSGVRIEG
jgi:hypothetical protein